MTASNTAERIVHAARTLFANGGAQAVSMRKVAARAGISTMAIYRHFGSRDALLKRIGDDSFEQITRHWNAHRHGGEVDARLLATQRIYLDYALAHPHLFDQAFAASRADARRFPDDFHAGHSPTLNVVQDVVVQAQQAGVLRPGDPWDIAMSLWAHAHGLIALYRAGRFNYDEHQFRAFYETSLQRLLDGLKAPALNR